MKKLFTLSALLFSLFAFAQHTPQEIKKYKISKITKLSTTIGDEATRKNEIFYDAYGNDTAEYYGIDLYRRTSYEYNAKGQAVKRSRYKANGNEIETAVYNYKPDGSYTISNTDKEFGMTDLTYLDKTGKTTKTVSPDRTERIYSYDVKGRLLRIKSKSSDNGGVVTDLQYYYNPKGQLIKESSKGDYKWTTIYMYDAKGMISKSKLISITDDVADPEVTTTYEYEFQ